MGQTNVALSLGSAGQPGHGCNQDMNALPRSQSTPGPDSAMHSSNLRLRIGDHVVDLGALRVLTRPTSPRLTSKAAAVLCELVRHAGDTVTRDHLLGSVWKNRVTTPDVLTQ